MSLRFIFTGFTHAFLLINLILYSGSAVKVHGAENMGEISRLPAIKPYYVGIILPPNIAPLNFFIEEPGRRFRAEIASVSGKAIEVSSRAGNIQIPEAEWHRML